MLDVCEIFKSVQGESTFAGAPCSFVRLAGCNLSCTYCDTPYARSEGVCRSVDDIVDEVRALDCSLVEVTGGEPLIQEETPVLCDQLLAKGNTVLVETNGTQDISSLPEGAIRIMDIKCPSSGMAEHFLFSNLQQLRPTDQCKFVISDREDFLWAQNFVGRHNVSDLCIVFFSPDTQALTPRELAEWILEEKLPVRLGLQLHKIIWGENARGV